MHMTVITGKVRQQNKRHRWTAWGTLPSEILGENRLKHRQPTVYKTDAGIALLYRSTGPGKKMKTDISESHESVVIAIAKYETSRAIESKCYKN
jgi:hypothetical protein